MIMMCNGMTEEGFGFISFGSLFDRTYVRVYIMNAIFTHIHDNQSQSNCDFCIFNTTKLKTPVKETKLIIFVWTVYFVIVYEIQLRVMILMYTYICVLNLKR
jgi:hypothetical protein